MNGNPAQKIGCYPESPEDVWKELLEKITENGKRPLKEVLSIKLKMLSEKYPEIFES